MRFCMLIGMVTIAAAINNDVVNQGAHELALICTIALSFDIVEYAVSLRKKLK